MSNVVKLKRPVRTFDARERLIDQVREQIFKWDYAKLAEAAGISKTTVMRLAQGYTKWPKPDTLFGLLEALDLKIEVVAKNHSW